MPKATHISKGVAAAFVILTTCAIGGLIALTTIYYITYNEMPLPTALPTFKPTTEPPPPDLRLPRYLIPDSYDVSLQLHFYSKIIEEVNVTSPNQTMVFTGNSTVHFQCTTSTTSIYLHSVDLSITDAVVKNKDTNEVITVSSVHQEEEGNFLVVKVNKNLEVDGNYSLSLGFNGEMTNNLDGLFMSYYTEGTPDYEDDPNANRYLAATNNEPTHARQIFPCFDEPDMKAVFNVTIIHRRDTIALGNTGAESTINRGDWIHTKFRPTERMSTYLFAFTVSEFDKFVLSPHERVTIQTYARPEAIAAGHADYAAGITGKILIFYEKLFGLQYTLKKLDQIALPDLKPAAMENWGLITYQEGVLLYDKEVSSWTLKETIASMISHELAHQWFGNLVTMKWWNQIWLNEGFATYFSNLAVDHVEPSFNAKNRFFLRELSSAFEEDALASSHPLNPPAGEVQTNDEIAEMFDTITYSKGGSVLRMLADAIGERVFNDGIKMYLSANKYENVDQQNLWEHMQKAVHDDGGDTDVAKVMSTWTDQAGYPVVTINTTTGIATQKRFLYNDTAESSLFWHIPIRVMSSTTTTRFFILHKSGPESYNQFLAKEGEWILANVNSTGYYRVNYNPENWEALLRQLLANPNRIPVINRGQLLDDVFNLARAKMVNITLALNLTRFLHKEIAYLPWQSAEENFQYIVLMFDRTEVNGPMQAYLQQQVEGLYNFLSNYTNNSTVPEDHDLQLSQRIAVQMACSNGLPACVDMATQTFRQWMETNGTYKIHANLRLPIYCQALASGGKKEWEFVWEKYMSSNDTAERNQLRAALSCTKKIWLLNRLLEYTLDPEKIRLMDVSATISEISENVAGQALAWNFIRAHWDYVSEGDDPYMITQVTGRFSTPFELAQLERFASDYDVGPYARAVEQAIEQTKVNIKWVDEYKQVILEWFEGQSSA